MASEGHLPVSRVTSPFRAETTAGSRCTHSADRPTQQAAASPGAYWWPKSLSDRVLFHRSTIPWSRWTSTRPRLTSTLCLARSWLTAPINSRPGSHLQQLGPLQRTPFVDARQGIGDLCCALASQRLGLLVPRGNVDYGQGVLISSPSPRGRAEGKGGQLDGPRFGAPDIKFRSRYAPRRGQVDLPDWAFFFSQSLATSRGAPAADASFLMAAIPFQ